MASRVTITCATEGASIYYTTDGSDPSWGVGTLYSSSFIVYKDTEVRAMAGKVGCLDSEIAIQTVDISIPTPTLTFTAGSTSDAGTISVTNTSAYSDYGSVTFYYTSDGTDPTTSSTSFTSSFSTIGNYTYKVKAFLNDGSEESSVASITVSTLQVQTPVITVTDS